MSGRERRAGVTVLVVGGKLQGVEICYLARQAGYRTVLVDRYAGVPASGLADEFVGADALDAQTLLPLFQEADIVFPAVEDAQVLEALLGYGERTRTPVVGDLRSYRTSSSKAASNALFARVGVPEPAAYPECGLPVVVKPDGLSGSLGVTRADTPEQLEQARAALGGGAVVQRFIEGRSFSMEVIGDGERFWKLPITEVCIAPDYDAERIIAPADLTDDERAQFEAIGQRLGERLRIDGIFDIEVMSDEGRLATLEIDARFPSQTPVSVYHATGINMVAELTEMRLASDAYTAPQPTRTGACWYQQIEVGPDGLKLTGEHPISACGPLALIPSLYGAEAVLTDVPAAWGVEGEGGAGIGAGTGTGSGADATALPAPPWRAIVITAGPDCASAGARFDRCAAEMAAAAQMRLLSADMRVKGEGHVQVR